jgi:hypothetical protein
MTITIPFQSYKIEFNKRQIDEVYNLFGKLNDVPNKVFSRAVHRTLDGTKTDMSSAIREVLDARKSDIDRTIKVKKTNSVTMSGSVGTGGVLPAHAFKFEQLPEGTKVKFYKNRQPEVIKSAFVAKAKSGKKIILIRENIRKRIGHQIKMDWRKLPMEARYPVRTVFAPSHVTVLLSGPVWPSLQGKIDKRLETNLKREINYVIKVGET